MYSFPQRTHLSVLPSGRSATRPLARCRRFASFARSRRQVGQYQARGPPSKTVPHWRQVRGFTTTAMRSPKQFFQLCQVLSVGADLAALPAGDHRLIYAHGIRKLRLRQFFGFAGRGNVKSGIGQQTLPFARIIAAARSLVFPMAGPFRSHRPSPAQCY